MRNTTFTENEIADLRRALNTIELQAPTGPDYDDVPILTHPTNRRLYRPVLTGLVAAAVVALVMLPALLIGSGGGTQSEIQNPTPATTSNPSTSAVSPPDDNPVQGTGNVLLDEYRALDGTLLSIGSEQGWLCPPRVNIGLIVSDSVAESELPQTLSFSLAGYAPTTTGSRDDGPICNQPPSVVMLAFEDEQTSAGIAGLTITPTLTRFEDFCPPDECQLEGGPSDPPLEELIINGSPAWLNTYLGDIRIWWNDSDGTPLFGEASGLTREQVLDTVGMVHTDIKDRMVEVGGSLPAGLEVVYQEPSIGVWDRGLSLARTFEVDGAQVQISTSFDSSKTPLSWYASNVDNLELVTTGTGDALWISEGGGFLYFTTDGGVSVWIEGLPSKELALQLATNLTIGAG